MTDDYLADFERELHAAAQRRAGSSRAPRRRWLAPVLATATAAAAVFVVLSIAGAPDPEVEAPATPANAITLPALEETGACAAREGTIETGPVHERMGIFRRTQHPPDAPMSGEVQSIPAGDYDGRAMRSPTGIGVRVLLAPTNVVGCDGKGEPGVCVIADGGSRCFELGDIERGRAVVLTRPGEVVGLAPDGIGSVTVEAGGRRTQESVVENAFLVAIPADARAAAITLEPLSGCAPSEAMRRAVPILDKSPDPGGAPRAVRLGYRGKDAAVVARYARIWGGGDGVTYWVAPRLRCDGAEQDEVCVVPLIEAEAGRDGNGGGDACAALGELGRTWIHFPLPDGGAAVAGFAPPGASDVRVRIREAGFEQRFTVKDGVWGGTLEDYRPRGEVGPLLVEFDVPFEAAPAVAVLNGTTTANLGRTVMDALESVNYRRATVGTWSAQNFERTIVFSDDRGLGERIAIHLGERFAGPRPDVRELSTEAGELGGEDADAVVVVGRDLVP